MKKNDAVNYAYKAFANCSPGLLQPWV